MRNTPSFIGDFAKQKPKPSTPRSSELTIEKEADLREKRKQILQRLKHKPEHENIESTLVSQRAHASNEEISEKVIFSPRTAKRFQEASHKRVEREIKRLNNVEVMPTIVLQEASGTHQTPRSTNETNGAGMQPLKKELPQTTPKKTNELQTYIPSFADRSPPLRKAQVSPSLSKKAKTSPKLLKKTNSSLEEERARQRQISNSQSPKYERKVLNNKLPAQKPPLLASNSLEVADNDAQSSPLRRSASFHSLKERNKALRNSGGRQFLDVNDKNHTTSSLPFIRLQSRSMGSVHVDNYDLSSTKSLKQQQNKLEEDFHRLEEDLDHAFNELRKYLKTS